MTQTVNAFADMPASTADLGRLAGRLEDVRQANVAHHIALMRDARDAGAQVICFGELFAGPYFALTENEMWRGLAEDAETGPTVTELRAEARACQMIVVAPIYERDGERRFNTAVVIDEHGEVLGRYRKTHIPHGRNEQGSFLEGFYYERSDGGNRCGPANVSSNPYFPVFRTSLGRIGVAICYDRHFEGVVWSLAREGAELVFCPAVTFGQKSHRLWPLEFQVDAARHNVVIGGSNRLGVEPPWNQPYFGDTLFVGPNGVLPASSPRPELVISDVDMGELRRPDPSGWNLPRDIRHDIYNRRGC